MGEHRQLTLTSPGDENGVELLLEPSTHPSVPPFKDAMVKDGISFKSFSVDNLDDEHARLEKLGVRCTQPPVTQEGYSTAVLNDTCGNLMQIIELANED